jgi:hypothetical protein
LPFRDSTPTHRTDEPYVRRWARAPRLVFLVLAGAGCWAMVGAVVWLIWRHFFG